MTPPTLRHSRDCCVHVQPNYNIYPISKIWWRPQNRQVIRRNEFEPNFGSAKFLSQCLSVFLPCLAAIRCEQEYFLNINVLYNKIDHHNISIELHCVYAKSRTLGIRVRVLFYNNYSTAGKRKHIIYSVFNAFTVSTLSGNKVMHAYLPGKITANSHEKKDYDNESSNSNATSCRQM